MTTAAIFEIEADEDITLYEVRVYRNRRPDYETVNFINGKGALALLPGLHDVVVLLWGKKGAKAKLKVLVDGDDPYEFSGKIMRGYRDVFSGQLLVGPISAFEVERAGEMA